MLADNYFPTFCHQELLFSCSIFFYLSVLQSSFFYFCYETICKTHSSLSKGKNDLNSSGKNKAQKMVSRWPFKVCAGRALGGGGKGGGITFLHKGTLCSHPGWAFVQGDAWRIHGGAGRCIRYREGKDFSVSRSSEQWATVWTQRRLMLGSKEGK